MIYIISHLSPDLDAAVSVIALEHLFEKGKCFAIKKAKPALASPPNLETKTIFKLFKTPLPVVLKSSQIKANDRFVLADHNEESQRLKGISPKAILEIYDHHRPSLNLPAPLYVNIKPWGATNTVIYWFMKLAGVKMPRDLASLMISAILSDTVGLKSPTTTDIDREAIEKLNQVAKIKNLKELTLAIFKSKSSLAGLSDQELLTKDYKIFNFSGKKILVNQLETVEQGRVIKISPRLINRMKTLKNKFKVDYFFCLITDIVEINSKLICPEKDVSLLLKAFPGARKIKRGVYNIGPILSRKKEVTPAIQQAI